MTTVQAKKPRMTKKFKEEIKVVDDKYSEMLHQNYLMWEKMKHTTLPTLFKSVRDDYLSYETYSVKYDKIFDIMDSLNTLRLRIREKHDTAMDKVRKQKINIYDYTNEFRPENRINKEHLYYKHYNGNLKNEFKYVLRELVRTHNHGVDMTEDEFQCIQRSNIDLETSCGMTYKLYRENQLRRGYIKVEGYVPETPEEEKARFVRVSEERDERSRVLYEGRNLSKKEYEKYRRGGYFNY